MFTKIVQRAILGFPLGVFICTTITVGISLAIGRGSYFPVVPSLAQATHSEISAVVLQYVLSGILGAGFAAGSVIFEVEHWSITRQTVAHFLLSSVLMFPVAYLAHWMEPTFAGVVVYLLVFVVIYALIWLVQYGFWVHKVQQINAKLQEK